MTTASTHPDQASIPCVVMRGGTSKALFFLEADLPPAGPGRDDLLKRAMGTPDAAQIDGMGGARLNTSKVAVVQVSGRPGVDIDYTFVQVETDRDGVSYDGNCGNISSAVGPFAIDEGLVEAAEPITTVRIHNTNTGKVLVARVPVAAGRARVSGDCVIAGVPGAGAEILMDYAGTVGSRTGRLLPTSRAVDAVALEDGRSIAASVCDVANPCIFVAARDLGLRGDERPAEIADDQALVAAIEEVRGRIGHSLGFWSDWRAGRPHPMPMLVIVAPPGEGSPAADLRAWLLYLGRCHESMAGTGAICLAAAARVPGTVVHAAIAPARAVADTVRIGHPSGVLEVKVTLGEAAGVDAVGFATLAFARTARRLMAGNLYVPAD